MADAAAIQNAADKTLEDIGKNESSRREIINIVMQRPDKGFGVKDEKIPLPFLTREYSFHESCKTCGGEGRTTCPRCHGQGQETCPRCHGRTIIPCSFCHSTGFIQQPDGSRQQCNRCFGRKTVACDLCHKTGRIPCSLCKSARSIICPSCKGAGWYTHIAQAAIIATARFAYDSMAIPRPAVEQLSAIGPHLVTEKHIQVNAAYAEGWKGQPAVEYTATFPYGDIEFTVKNETVSGKILGFHPMLLKFPPFLEKLVQPGIAALEQAASGQGFVASHIRSAARYRLLGYALVVSVRASAKKTESALRKKFPMGLSPEASTRIAELADRATEQVGRRPRFLGLAIGLAIVAGLYALYYIGPGRTALGTYIPGEKWNILIDLIIIALGGTLTTASIKLVGARAMRHALGHIVPQKQYKRLIPRARESRWWGYAGGAVLYLLMIELTVHMNAVTPEWYKTLRHIILP